MAWYSSGTVALTANSTTVTGTGTQFLGNIRIGDGLVIAGSSALHEVTGISSDTQLTFQPPFAGDAGSGLNYAAVPVLGYDKDLSDAFNRLRLEIGDHLKNLQDLQDWVLDPTNTAIDAAAAAESARDEAQTARTQAQDAEGVATQQAVASEASRQAADTSRDTALAAATDAEASRDQAGVYEQQSGANAAASEASRIAAEQAVQEAEGLVPSETPAPGLVPKADASGALAIGWVPYVSDISDDVDGLSGRVSTVEDDVASLQGQAANAYRPSNILGTVSQLDGVPTGAIIERGSNASGEYVKYADGTLICYRRFTYTAVINLSAGSLFFAQAPNPSGSPFPHAFVATPACTYTADTGAGNTSTFVMTYGESTQYRWHSINPFSPTTQGSMVVFVSMTAIGRWY